LRTELQRLLAEELRGRVEKDNKVVALEITDKQLNG